MEDVDDEDHHVFERSSIEKMEMMLVKTLEWRLYSPTPYSYIQLIFANNSKLELLSINNNNKNELLAEKNLMMMNNIRELVIGGVLDYNLIISFTPTLIALSAIWCSLDLVADPMLSEHCLLHFMTLFNLQHHKVIYINSNFKLNSLSII